MTEITIWHNPKCSKSRQSLALIQEKTDDINVRLYLQDPPHREDLSYVLKLLGLSVFDIIRTGEAFYKENNLKQVTDEQKMLDILSQEPRLIERPIVICGDQAVIGRPPENILRLFDV